MKLEMLQRANDIFAIFKNWFENYIGKDGVSAQSQNKEPNNLEATIPLRKIEGFLIQVMFCERL